MAEAVHTHRRRMVATAVLVFGACSLPHAAGQGLPCGGALDPLDPVEDVEDPLLEENCFGPSGPAVGECRDDNCLIESIVFYNAAARDAAASAGLDIVAEIRRGEQFINQAFVNTGLHTTVRIVAVEEVVYDNSNDHAAHVALTCLGNRDCFPEAHALRDFYRADLMTLYVTGLAGAGGISFLGGAASVVNWSTQSTGVDGLPRHSYVYMHELGHNFKGCHQASFDSCLTLPSCYAYIHDATTGDPQPHFRTILASPDTSKTILHFSNWLVDYIGEPTGTLNANNVTCFANTFGSASRLRTSDCNLNGLCDYLEPDCNSNNVVDECDLDPADPDEDGFVSADCNGNTTPDECDVNPADPDGDGSVSGDCNSNLVPDECETLADCNLNGLSDACEIASSPVLDCENSNGILDACEPSLPRGACCLVPAPKCKANRTACQCVAGGGTFGGVATNCTDACGSAF